MAVCGARMRLCAEALMPSACSVKPNSPLHLALYVKQEMRDQHYPALPVCQMVKSAHQDSRLGCESRAISRASEREQSRCRNTALL